MVMSNKNAGIKVYNSLLNGVESPNQMPTFILDLHSLSIQEVDAVIDCVAMIQTLSPTFRVVAMGESSIFKSTAVMGWPFEHLMPPEHVSRLDDRRQFKAYREERVKIAAAHYSNARIIRETSYRLYASAIGKFIERPDIVTIALELADTDAFSASSFIDFGSAINELRDRHEVTIVAPEGSALIATDHLDRSAYFLYGGSSGSHQLGAIRDKYLIPDDVAILRVEFDPNSTIRFESFLYAEFARTLRSDLIIVMPARLSAVLDYDVLQWVDLSATPSRFPIEIVDEYAEGYRLLSNSRVLDWNFAHRYSIARRISRNFPRE